MGTARFETIIDFGRHKVDAAIRCDGCGHTRKLTSAELGKALGYATRLAEARRRLKCSICGHRGARLSPVPRFD